MADNDSPWEYSRVLEAKGEYKQAAALIQPLIEAGGDVTEYALLRYAWLNYLLHNQEESLRHYQKALKVNPESIDARLGMTLPLMAMHRWNEVEQNAKQILRRSPWHFIAHQRLMAAEEGQRHWGILKKHASELAARYPSSYVPLVFLARAEIWLGDNTAARQAYVRVLRRMPSHIEANAFINKP